jgi:hypothetical protein
MSTLIAVVFDDESGRVFQTSLSKDDERALREVLEKPAAMASTGARPRQDRPSAPAPDARH